MYKCDSMSQDWISDVEKVEEGQHEWREHNMEDRGGDGLVDGGTLSLWCKVWVLW